MIQPSTYEKHKQLIGTEINTWKILDIVTTKNKHHAYVLAQCHCGTVKEERLTYIKTGHVKDCGCGHRARLNAIRRKKYEHLIGTQINGWTVLDVVPPNEQHDRTYMLCQCQCGTIKEVQLQYLKNGRSKNCGCGRKETLCKIFTKNLVGQKFGKLTVVEMLEERNEHGKIIYKCQCDCGNEVNVLGNSLTTCHTMSCGCLVSYWNMYIQQFLENNKIECKPEYTVHIDDSYYRFDFYLPQYNLMIEYDGQQHYEPVNFGGMNEEEMLEKLKIIQQHDAIKTAYCKDNNILLLRIPYWESKNIETIINNYLQRLNEEGLVA